jgi:hypothetical protein
MNIPNFREKGTKLPTIPAGTKFNAVYWAVNSKNEGFDSCHNNFISYGYKRRNGFNYILCEKPYYTNNTCFFMIKESIIIDLWKKENNWTEDTFVLPEKWKLKVSRLEDIEEYLISKYGKVDKWILDTIGFNLILYSDEASLFYPKYISTVDKEDYTEITFEEFQKHVLKKEETMKKEIIGYKLIKPEYKKAYLRIAGIAETGCSTPGCDFAKDGIVHHNVKEAGVLDLWFQPVYKNSEKFIKMGDAFDLRVTSKGIYHNSENITDYVSSVVYWYKNIPTKFSKYDFIIDDLILSKTGCEVEKTSIKEWIAVWEEYINLSR